jgi:hypothetical protein
LTASLSVDKLFVSLNSRSDVNSDPPRRSNGASVTKKPLFLYIAVFSLHLALAGASIALFLIYDLDSFFGRYEFRINHALGIRQTHFARGHITVGLPTLMLAVPLCLALWAFSTSRRGRRFLVTSSAAISTLVPLTFWIGIRLSSTMGIRWPYSLSVLETASVAWLALLIGSGKRSLPDWVMLLAMAVHFFYWDLAPGGEGWNWEYPGYLGPTGPLLGLCAAWTWVLTRRSVAQLGI